MGMKAIKVRKGKIILPKFQYPKVGSMGMKDGDGAYHRGTLLAFQYPKVGSMGMKGNGPVLCPGASPRFSTLKSGRWG